MEVDIYDDIYDLYIKYGNNDYIGENVSQLEHAMQCAEYAFIYKSSDEVIIAALLHDIGHLLGIKTGEKSMSNTLNENLGIASHEVIGADYLKNLGFSDMICSLVRNHVNIKRYMCGIDHNYLNKLSYGSSESLKMQGGPMNQAEIKEFEDNPYFSWQLLLRNFDDKAKVVNKDIDHKKYWDILRKYIITIINS